MIATEEKSGSYFALYFYVMVEIGLIIMSSEITGSDYYRSWKGF